MNLKQNRNIGWKRVLIIIIPYILIVGIFQYLGKTIVNPDFNEKDYQLSSIEELILSFVDLLSTFFLLWLFMKYIDKTRFIKLGFSIKNRLSEIGIGIGIGVLIMSIGYLLLLSLNELSFQKITFDFSEILISILLFLIIAVVEETFLRGYVLRNLMISFNKYIALIISAILFVLMHGVNPNISLFSLFELFIGGLTLGISYLYTKNLWFPIAMHFSWNLFQTLFGFNVSGQDRYSLIEFTISQNNILNGGSFGFEGSILSIIAQILIIIGIVYYYEKKKTKFNKG